MREITTSNVLVAVAMAATSLFATQPPAAAQSALPPPGFHHLHLNAVDPDAAIAYYTRQFPSTSKAVWSGMRDRGYGRVLFTSSASGIYGNFGQANYGAAKAAMIGLMNVLHLEGAKYDIRVNVLAPTAATGMTAGLLSPEVAALLTPESVTPAVLFLVGENAPSRTIMGAGGGVFAVTHIEETPGVFLPEAERTPEKIAACFAEIADRASAVPLENAYAQTFKFAAAAKGMGVALPQ